MDGEQSAPQGSQEWHQQRLGMVTASRLKDMMTNGRGKDTMGATAYSYMWDLIAERITGSPAESFTNDAMDWGNQNEPHARALYCLHRQVSVTKTGFVLHPEIQGVGGSPDGLVTGDKEGDGGVEIKCPFKSRIHLQYVESGGVPSEYQMQVQGLMWITGRSWWDFVSFDPRMPEHLQLYVYRERADKDLHADIEHRAKRFVEQINLKTKRLQGVAK
jgi:putative phage-type endonuclease